MIKKYTAKLTGINSLIMHNAEGANPLGKYAKERKELTAKRSGKTDEHLRRLAEIDFLTSLYWSDSLGGLYMPVENTQKMLLEAARALDQRKAKKQIIGVKLTTPIGWPIDVIKIGGQWTKDLKDKSPQEIHDLLLKDPSNKYFKMVTVQKSRTPNTKAIFKHWEFEVEFEVDTDIVDADTVQAWWEYARTRVGLGARRPYGPTPGQYGIFQIDEYEEIKK